MDILISSNLERFLYEISGRNEDLISMFMKRLKEEGRYEITEDMKEKLKILYGGFASEKETLEAVKKVYESSNYIMDTHTAVAYDVYEKYKKNTGDNTITVIASTASPFKFPRSISEALNFSDDSSSEFDIVKAISNKFDIKIPNGIKGLDEKEIRHSTTCKKDEMREVIKGFLQI
jgi:threonine synthase